MTEVVATPEVAAASLRFELDADRGVFHLLAAGSGERIASHLECAVETDAGVVSSAGSRAVWRPLPESQGGGVEIQFAQPDGLQLGLAVGADAISGGLTLTLRVTNEGRACRLKRLFLLYTGEGGTLDLVPDAAKARLFRNGWQAWDEAASAAGPGESWLATGILNPETGQAVVLGFAGADRQFGRIGLDTNGSRTSITASAEMEGAELPRDASVTSETLWIGYSRTPALLLLDYSRFRTPPRPPHRAAVVWDSWLVNYEQTTEQQILETVEQVRTLFPEIDTIVVGDGYQKIQRDGPGIGDWLETNPRFPHGLGWLAQQIKKRGLRAGIWLAPFLIGERSQFYKYYPDARLRPRDPDAEPWYEMWRGDRAYYLDMSHPDARNFVRDIFEQLSYRWGYELFLIDFAYAGAAEGFRKESSTTRAETLHAGLEMIRRVVGDDRTLLLSGAPLGLGAGVVDAVLSTPDSGPSWEGACGVKAAAQAALARSFLGGAPPLMASSLAAGGLTADELRLAATAFGLTGGPLSISGPLNKLTAAQVQILRKAIPRGSYPGAAVDLLERRTPRVFSVPVPHHSGSWWVVGVFNTSDRPSARSVEFSQLGLSGPQQVYEFWEHQYLGVLEDRVTLDNVPPHSCRLLAIHPDQGRPQFLSVDDHLLQGVGMLRRVEWREAEGRTPARLLVDLAHDGPADCIVSFTSPEGMVARQVNARSGRARLTRERSSGRLFSVETTFRDRASFEVLF